MDHIFSCLPRKCKKPPLYDTVDGMVKELVCNLEGVLIKTKTEIEKECNIKKNSSWSIDDIKRALEKTKRMDECESKDWSFVIVLQELKRRLAETALEDEDVQAYHRENTDSRSLESNTDMVRADLQIPGNFNQMAIEEQPEEHQEPCYILIPFSVMSENTSTPNEDSIPNTRHTYKLKDKDPYKNINGKPSVKRKSYAMSFNNETNNADWVYEILNESTLAKNCSKPEFNNKYYQKGHLAAAANHMWCLEAKNDASVMRNRVPQYYTLNNRMWKILENDCRAKINNCNVCQINKSKCKCKCKSKSKCNVHVYTGPVYNPDPNPCFVSYKGKDNEMRYKTLPTALFKVIIVEHDNGTVQAPECYLIPNEDSKSNDYSKHSVRINCIERVTGLTFTEPLPSKTMDSKKTITWVGKDDDDKLCTAEIEVIISS